MMLLNTRMILRMGHMRGALTVAGGALTYVCVCVCVFVCVCVCVCV